MIEKGSGIHEKSLDVYYLDFIIEHFGFNAAVRDEVDHVGENLVGMAFVVADAANPDGSQLPDIVVIHLSHRHVELVAHPAGDGFKDLPLTLEGHVFRQAELDLAHPDVHIILRLVEFNHG